MSENQVINHNGLFEYPFPAIFPGMSFSTSAISNLIDEVESMFNMTGIKKSFPYPMNISVRYNKETSLPEQYLIEIALAGFRKDEVKVKLIQNKALRVDLNPIEETLPENCDWYEKYLSHGIAKRAASYTWSLTPRIDAKNMVVKYEDGVLFIALPIINESKNKEQEEINIDIQ